MSDGCIVIVPGGPPRDVCESSASTSTTLPFTQPAVGADVAVNVGTTDWISSGQVLFVEGGGYYTAVPSTATEVRLTNLGYAGNAAPGAVINPPQLVSPGGLQGPAVTYQITYKPGGVAVPGQVVTTNADLNTLFDSLVASGGAVTCFLDGSANGNAVNFSLTHDYLNKISFVALDPDPYAVTALAVTTDAGVQLKGVQGITGYGWAPNTTTSACFVPSVGKSGWSFRMTEAQISTSSAAHAAIEIGTAAVFMTMDGSGFGGAQPSLDVGSSYVFLYMTNNSYVSRSNNVKGTGQLYLFADISSTFAQQTTLTGAGGTANLSLAIANWNPGATYPVGTTVYYNGTFYESLVYANNQNKNPATQQTFWKPVSRQRYSNATADLWYQLTGAGPYANGGTAGVEAMTSSAGVVENQAGPFGTAPVIPTGERIRTATSTKNPAAAAATVWAWCRPGRSVEALLWGKLVDASDVTASIRIGFTAAGLPTASIRRTGQPADDTATAGAEHTLGAGQMVLIAATYDGANLRLYVNGELAATTAAAGTLANTALSSWIAGATLGGLTPFVGKLDEVGMDNTVYPQATLAKMAAAGLAWLS